MKNVVGCMWSEMNVPIGDCAGERGSGGVLNLCTHSRVCARTCTCDGKEREMRWWCTELANEVVVHVNQRPGREGNEAVVYVPMKKAVGCRRVRNLDV